MNHKSVRVLLALLLAAAFVVAAPGCAARNLINAVTNGILPPTAESAAPAETESALPDDSLPDPGEDNTEEAASDRILVPFPDMMYSRPSVDITVRALNSIADQLRGSGGDPETLNSLVGEANSVYDSYETETVLAMIHDAMDRSDSYWSEEYEFCTNAYGRISEAYANVQRAYRETAQPDAAEASSSIYDVTGIVDLIDEQSRLGSQYQTLLSTLTADSDGIPFTYAEIETYLDSEQWHAQNARTIGEVYVELAKVRQRMAQALGYPNYIEYSFNIMNSGYTPEMVQSLLQEIQNRLVPISAAVGSGGIYPDLSLTEDEALRMLGSWLPKLDESMAESLSLMRDYQLYDFSVGPYKDPIAFTTYLPSYAAPFLMLSFTGDYNSFGDLIHEFGHFNNYAVDPTAYSESPDIGEVFSTALPLLCSRFFDEDFGATGAQQLTKRLLIDCLDTFTYQAYFVGFELAVYSLPEDQITYENLCAISEEQWYRFGQAPSPLASVDWTSTVHLVDSAFYVMSYIVATDVALQIWEQSISDPQAAMDTYYNLMENNAEGMGFMENITAAGLASPFSEDQIALQAAYLSSILMMDMTPEQARASQLGITTEVTPETPEPAQEEPVPDATETPQPAAEPTPAYEPEAETSRPRFETHYGYTDGNYTIPLG